jgi:hypothetical protein
LWKRIAAGAHGRSIRRGKPSPGAASLSRSRLRRASADDPRAARVVCAGLEPPLGDDDELRGDRDHVPWYAGRFRASTKSRVLAGALRPAPRDIGCILVRPLRHEPPGRGHRGHWREPRDPEVAHVCEADGRVWAWEGCFDRAGLLPWVVHARLELAQALPHLFPDLEDAARDGVQRVSG